MYFCSAIIFSILSIISVNGHGHPSSSSVSSTSLADGHNDLEHSCHYGFVPYADMVVVEEECNYEYSNFFGEEALSFTFECTSDTTGIQRLYDGIDCDINNLINETIIDNQDSLDCTSTNECDIIEINSEFYFGDSCDGTFIGNVVVSLTSGAKCVYGNGMYYDLSDISNNQNNKITLLTYQTHDCSGNPKNSVTLTTGCHHANNTFSTDITITQITQTNIGTMDEQEDSSHVTFKYVGLIASIGLIKLLL